MIHYDFFRYPQCYLFFLPPSISVLFPLHSPSLLIPHFLLFPIHITGVLPASSLNSLSPLPWSSFTVFCLWKMELQLVMCYSLLKVMSAGGQIIYVSNILIFHIQAQILSYGFKTYKRELPNHAQLVINSFCLESSE